jgi:hypothetical protein
MTTQGSVHIGLGKRVAWAIATLGILIISCQSGPAPLIAGSNLGSIPSTRPVFPVRPGHFDLPPCHIGMACCTSPYASFPYCDTGFGCLHGVCSACGQPGEPCCDDPMLQVTSSGNTVVVSPLHGEDPHMYDACPNGTCVSGTCQACGNTLNGRCCPADAVWAELTCKTKGLTCSSYEPSQLATARCVQCGVANGPPCSAPRDGFACEPGTGLGPNGLCIACGQLGQPACDGSCQAPYVASISVTIAHDGSLKAAPAGKCIFCGEPLQPACSTDKPCNGTSYAPVSVGPYRVCACGVPGTPKCYTNPSGPQSGTTGHPCGAIVAGCSDGRFCCGGACVLSDTKNCGTCGNACTQGTTCQGSSCASQTTCPAIADACVPDGMPGTHCCQPPGVAAPEVCNFGHCATCVLHGGLCTDYGTQICCDGKDGDSCVLDQASGQLVCNIPDSKEP